MLSDAFGAGVEEVRVEQDAHRRARVTRCSSSGPELREREPPFPDSGIAGSAFATARASIESAEALLWTLETGFYASEDLGPKPRDGWTVSIEGDPSFQTHFRVP